MLPDRGSFQEAIADTCTWRGKLSNVNIAMRNVNISVERYSKSGIRRPTHNFALM